MQARQALTGALKIWWDQSQLHSKEKIPDWQPALLPAMFVGAKAAAAAMESSARPNQVSPLPPEPCLSYSTLLLNHEDASLAVPLCLPNSRQLVLGSCVRQLSSCHGWLLHSSHEGGCCSAVVGSALQ